MKEREIKLFDLFFELLLKWRMMIVAIVIGGILLGGYTYLQSVNAYKMQNNLEIQENVDGHGENLLSVENVLTDEEKNNVKNVLSYEEYSEYSNNSLIMQMDANSVSTMDMIFSVDTPNEKDKIIIFSVYSQIIKNGIVEWLTQKGVEPKEAAQVADLVTVKVDVGNQNEALLAGKKGVIIVSIMHVDETQCKTLADEIKVFILEKEVELEAVYGEMEVNLIEEIYAKLSSLDILNKQRAILTNAVAGNVTAESLKMEFSDNEMKYYELLKGLNKDDEDEGNIENGETISAVVAIQQPAIDFKFTILGMIAFAFLYVFFVFVRYLFNNKICATDSMAELYDIVQLGVVSTVGGKKKFLGFVDNLIIKLRDRNKRQFTKEESEEIVAVAIKMAVKKLGDKEVSFVGCDIKKYTEEISNEIKVFLEKEGIAVSVVDNILYNAENLEKLENIKNVVLLEKVGFTMYDEVEQELEVMKRYNINVVGAVLVD